MRLSLAIQSGQPLRAGAHALSSEAAELIELSRTSGAPLGRLIESEIQLTSARAIQQIISQARQLSISLLVPMAVTVLPAFLILTVVPMFIGIGF
jgi:tight adherence protein B